jgi:hypothetical protein
VDPPYPVIKQVFAVFPASAAAGPGQFRGAAVIAGQNARWDLAVTGVQPTVRLLRPAVLYRAPLPRTKLEASVPDGTVGGLLEAGGHRIEVDQWRAAVGHNWGTEHADRRRPRIRGADVLRFGAGSSGQERRAAGHPGYCRSSDRVLRFTAALGSRVRDAGKPGKPSRVTVRR